MIFRELKFHDASYNCSEAMKPFTYGNFGPIAVAHGIREACENPGKVVVFASVTNSKFVNRGWRDEEVIRIFRFVVVNGELCEVLGDTVKITSIATGDYGKPDILSAIALDRIYHESEQLNFSIFRLDENG